MAAENIEVGKLSVPVMADLKPLERQAKSELKQRAQSIGREMVADLDRAFQAAQRRARGKLADRVLPKSEFKRLGKEAAEEFNRGLDEKIGQLNRAGKLTPAKLMQLEKFRKTGADAGFEFGDALQRRVQRPAEDAGREAGRRLTGGIMQQVNRLPSLIRAALGVALFTWIARGLRNIARQVANIATLASTAQQVRGAFTARTQGAGMDPGELLRELRQATLGTVDSVELMRRANLLLNSELSLTERNVGELAYLFRRLAEEQGRTATDGFGAVSESIARLSPRQLAAYGITVRLEDATKKWAEANGRTASSLTTAERQLALYNAIVEQAREKVAGLNEEHVSTAQRVQQVATWWGELKAAIAEGIMQAPRIAAFFDAMGVGASNAADRMGELSDRISAIIEKYGASLTGAGIGALGLGIAGTVVGTPLLGLAGAAVGAFGGSAIGQFWDSKEPLDAIQARIREERLAREAAGMGRPGTGPGGIPNADQLQAADAALRQLTASMREFEAAAQLGVQSLRDAPDEVQAAIRAMVKVQEQVRAAEEQIAAIRAGGQQVPEGAEAYLAGLRAELAELREIAQEEIERWQRGLPLIISGVENSISRLPALMIRVDGTVRTLGSAMGELRTQADAVAEAESQLLHARLAQDPERIAAAEKRIADERKRLRDMTAALAKGLAAAGLPAEKLNELLAEMNGLLEGAGMKAEGITEGGRDWEQLARTFEGVARGVLSIADAMGVLDDRQRRVLQGAIDLAAGIGQIASGNVLGGAFQAAGGAVGIIKGIVGDSAAASRERLRQIDEMVRLREALENLRKAVLSDVTAQERDRIVAANLGPLSTWERIFEQGRKLRTPGFGADGVIRGNIGMSEEAIAAIRDLERETGVSILGDGQLNVAKWREALEIFQNMDLGLYGDTLTEQLDNLNWLLRALGDDAGPATEQLDRFLAVLRSAGAKGFADQFQRVLDEQGAGAAQEWLNTLIEGVAAGDQSLFREGGIFAGLTAREVQRILEQAGGYLSGSGIVGSGAETRLAVNLTQTQGDELLRIGSTQLYHLAGIHSLIAQMVSAPPPAYGALPDISPPSPASLGLGGGSQVIQQIGDISVELNFPGSPGGLTATDLVEAGRAAGTAFGDAAGERLRSAYRGSGAGGPARYKVEVR